MLKDVIKTYFGLFNGFFAYCLEKFLKTFLIILNNLICKMICTDYLVFFSKT